MYSNKLSPIITDGLAAFPQVEPTGLLSVETALAKHRLGAAAQNGRGNGIMEPFADSAILAGRGELQVLITEW